jgi:hypothetical protein
MTSANAIESPRQINLFIQTAGFVADPMAMNARGSSFASNLIYQTLFSVVFLATMIII